MRRIASLGRVKELVVRRMFAKTSPIKHKECDSLTKPIEYFVSSDVNNQCPKCILQWKKRVGGVPIMALECLACGRAVAVTPTCTHPDQWIIES